MEKVAHSELIATKNELDALLTQLGLPIILGDRLHLAYKLLENFEAVRTDPVKSIEYLRKYNQNAEIHFALYDIQAFQFLMPHIQDIDEGVLKEKLKIALGGSSPAHEQKSNTAPRDTLFEFQLFAQLKRAGLNAVMCSPNPDIEVHINGRIYNIQCKRITTPDRSGMRGAVNKAFKQLNTDIRRKPGSYGIVALSIENFYTAGGKALITDTVADALANLSVNLQIFFQTYEYLWHNPTKIRNENTVAVLAYISALTITKSDRMQSSAHYIGFTNTYQPASGDFKQCAADFDGLSKLADIKRVYER